MHQLLPVRHEICKSFDFNPSLEVRGVFFGISKAFDRVWHDDLLYKLKFLEICGSYYNLIQSLLDSRHQRVVLNGQSLKWSLVEAGIPQGSILGPLLFLVCAVMQKKPRLLMTLHFSLESLVLQYHRQILMKT